MSFEKFTLSINKDATIARKLDKINLSRNLIPFIKNYLYLHHHAYSGKSLKDEELDILWSNLSLDEIRSFVDFCKNYQMLKCQFKHKKNQLELFLRDYFMDFIQSQD